MGKERFLLVIPCFREAARLQVFLTDLCPLLADLPGLILVVDDGSGLSARAITHEIVEKQRALSANLLAMLALETNTGKGEAIYEGWKHHADAKWLAFVDADGASSAIEVRRLLMVALEQANQSAIIASRIKMLGKTICRSFYRHFSGRMFATLASNLLDLEAYDTQCGLKIIPRAAYERVAPLLQTKNFAFDVELLAALLDAGCPVVEVPIDWSDIPGSKVSLFRDSWRMFCELWRIRRRRQSWPLHLS